MTTTLHVLAWLAVLALVRAMIRFAVACERRETDAMRERARVLYDRTLRLSAENLALQQRLALAYQRGFLPPDQVIPCSADDRGATGQPGPAWPRPMGAHQPRADHATPSRATWCPLGEFTGEDRHPLVEEDRP